MKRSLALMAALVLLFPLAALAQSEGYDSRSYARLSYVSGDVHVQRAGGLGYEAGTVNLALVEGDKLGLQEGRAEVSLGRQNYVRLDRLTQVEFINLPRGGNESYKLHLLNGSLYLRVSRMDQDKEFEVHTPDASFYILTVGLYRWDVRDNGETGLSIFEGQVEAAGETGSLNVDTGRSVIARNGNLVSGPDNLYADADDFGRWNQSRDSLLASRTSSSYLPQDINEYEPELDTYGDWHYEADYGYVWVPQVDYYNDWHPYYYGRWVWYPIIGWTWVPDEPWGWCVYHYGRWQWGLGLGWYWIPTHQWGPAWVNWYCDNDYLSWCPLNWRNRPVVVINNVFYNNYGNQYYSIRNAALTVINRNQLQARRMSEVALRGSALDRIGQVRLSNRQPNITPATLRSGRLYDQARRTFERSAGRPVGQVYSGSRSGRSDSLIRSGQERGTLRSLGGRNGTLSGRSLTLDNRGSSVSRSGLSSRQIREFSPNRSTSVPFQSRRTLSDSSRSIRSTTSPDSGSGFSSSSFLREFRSQTSSGRAGSAESSSRRLNPSRSSSRLSEATSSPRSVLNREYSSRFSSSDRANPFSSPRTYSSSGSSSRSSSRSTSFPSRSSAGPSRLRPSYDFSSPSRSSSSSDRGYSSPRQNFSSFGRNFSAPSRNSSFSNRISSSPSRDYSFSNRSSSSPSRSYSMPQRSSSSPSYSAPSRDSSFSNRSVSSPSHNYSRPNNSYSLPSRSSSSSSSSHNSSNSGSRIRHRDR